MLTKEGEKMRSKMLLLIVVLLSVTALFAQEKMIEAFDVEYDSTTTGFNAAPLNYEKAGNADPDSCYAHLTWVDNPVFEGDKALRIDYRIQDSESWGGYHKLSFSKEDSNDVYDFSGYDTLSFRYYVEESSSQPLSFRLNLTDCAEAEDGNLSNDNSGCEYYYSLNDNVLIATPGQWVEQKIAIVSNGSWDGSAFNQTTWAGVVGNGVIDKDKIKSIDFEFSIADNVSPTAHGVILLDNLVLKGAAKVDLVLFNGRAFPANITLEQPWSGSVEVTDEEDAYPEGGTNSIKWNAGAQWAGPIMRVSKPQNLHFSWTTDSVQFKVKGEAGSGGLQVKFADSNEGDGDYPFEAVYDLTGDDIGWDGTWKQIKIALADFNRFSGVWWNDHTEPGEFDSSKVNMFGIIANDANNDGKTIYLDDIWTGNPTFDLFPPSAPSSVSATPYPTNYYNLIMWQDVEGESGEVYDVYASPVPMDSLTAPTVEKIATGVLEGTMAATHYLKYPLVDGQLDYYYAVVCSDAAGNVGEPGFSDKVTGTAKGVPTVSLNVPSNFVADGFLDEWYDSGIKPFVIKPETDNVAAGSMTDSTDLKATVYVAIDDNFLYMAADVVDDVFFHSESNNWWCNDALDFFIGLYNLQGGLHQSYNSTNEPDHKMQMRANGFTDEITSGYTLENGSENYYFEGFDPDYVFEVKISLDSLVSDADEKRFHPVNGMKIPFDLYFHDNDLGSADHESAIAWSPNNTDHAWQTPTEWTYTFIGDEYGVGIDDDAIENVASTFNLEQNYPNPFNPTTTINYSLAKQEMVKISVYNVLGQKVAQLVNKNQRAGAYNIQWNAANYASGMYLYRIEAGDFVRTKKMLLMK